MPQNSDTTILAWLKEAGAHAFKVEAPARAIGGLDITPGADFFMHVDILVNEGTVGVRAVKGDRQEYQAIAWGQLERAESNPIIPLIDALAALVRKA